MTCSNGVYCNTCVGNITGNFTRQPPLCACEAGSYSNLTQSNNCIGNLQLFTISINIIIIKLVRKNARRVLTLQVAQPASALKIKTTQDYKILHVAVQSTIFMTSFL